MTPEALEVLRYQDAGATVYWSRLTGRWYVYRQPCPLHGIYKAMLQPSADTIAELVGGRYLEAERHTRIRGLYLYITDRGRAALAAERGVACSS